MSIAVDSPNYFLNLLLIFVRVMALLMVAPIFGSRSFPIVPRVATALLLAFVLVSVNGHSMVEITSTPQFVVLLVEEALIGLLIGFASTIVFVGLQYAASLMGVQSGLSMATALDPGMQNQTTVLDQFYAVLAGLIFLSMDGHHLVLLGLQRSMDVMSTQKLAVDDLMLNRLIVLTGNIFVIAVQVALPVMGTLLVADIAMALMARMVPQLNVFALGFPVKLALGLLVMLLTVPLFMTSARNMFSHVMEHMTFLLRGA